MFINIARCKVKQEYINPIPGDKNLTLSKLKAFADNKINVTYMIISVSDIQNPGKREKTGYQDFLLFPQCFEKASFPDMSKGVTMWEWVNPFPNDKTLDMTKLKAFADNKLNIAKLIE